MALPTKLADFQELDQRLWHHIVMVKKKVLSKR
jgi:hypothetical protein